MLLRASRAPRATREPAGRVAISSNHQIIDCHVAEFIPSEAEGLLPTTIRQFNIGICFDVEFS